MKGWNNELSLEFVEFAGTRVASAAAAAIVAHAPPAVGGAFPFLPPHGATVADVTPLDRARAAFSDPSEYNKKKLTEYAEAAGFDVDGRWSKDTLVEKFNEWEPPAVEEEGTSVDKGEEAQQEGTADGEGSGNDATDDSEDDGDDVDADATDPPPPESETEEEAAPAPEPQREQEEPLWYPDAPADDSFIKQAAEKLEGDADYDDLIELGRRMLARCKSPGMKRPEVVFMWIHREAYPARLFQNALRNEVYKMFAKGRGYNSVGVNDILTTIKEQLQEVHNADRIKETVSAIQTADDSEDDDAKA